MFRCDSCGTQQEKGVKPQRVVMERRDMVYKDKDGKVLGKGWEIVREASLCVECAERIA